MNKLNPLDYVGLYHQLAQLETDWDNDQDRHGGVNSTKITLAIEEVRKQLDAIVPAARVNALCKLTDDPLMKELNTRLFAQSGLSVTGVSQAQLSALEMLIEAHRVTDDEVLRQFINTWEILP